MIYNNKKNKGELKMLSQTKRIDDLGRVAIPKEMKNEEILIED